MRFLISISIIITGLLFTACPHHFVEKIEGNFKDGNYEPSYVVSPSDRRNVSIGEKQKCDSSNIPVTLELRNVNAREFPDKVELIAIARDSAGRFIAGLAEPYLKNGMKQGDFWTLLTDSCEGVNTNIEDFTVKEIREDDAEPFAVSYVLDYSGSMGLESKKSIQNAIPMMLKSSKVDDYISVILFGKKTVIEVPLEINSDYLKRNQKINLKPDTLGAGTDIYKGLKAAFEELSKAPDKYQRIIILISDGVYTFKKNQWDDIVKQTRELNLKIYTITLGFGWTGPVLMKKLADISGGRFYQILFDFEFPYVFADIYLKLKNYYIITYKAPDCKNLHRAGITLNMDMLGQGNKYAEGYYDKSVFVPIDPVGTVNFLNIEFEFAKAEIRPESYSLIDKVAMFMKHNSDVKIRIAGHTDDIGTDEDNQKLSEERADAVYNYLTEKGINRRRLETIGWGESKPLVSNDSEENRRKNRRTEFEIIEK